MTLVRGTAVDDYRKKIFWIMEACTIHIEPLHVMKERFYISGHLGSSFSNQKKKTSRVQKFN